MNRRQIIAWKTFDRKSYLSAFSNYKKTLQEDFGVGVDSINERKLQQWFDKSLEKVERE